MPIYIARHNGLQDVTFGEKSVTLQKRGGRHWGKIREKVINEVQHVDIDGVIDVKTSVAENVKKRYQQEQDSVIVLYNFRFGVGTSMVENCVNEILKKLKTDIENIFSAQELVRKVSLCKEEDLLSTEDLLKRKESSASFEEVVEKSPPNTSRRPSIPPKTQRRGSLRGGRRMSASIEAQEALLTSYPRGSFVIAGTGRPHSASATTSMASTPLYNNSHNRPAKLREEVKYADAYAFNRRRSSLQSMGCITSMTDKQGHQGDNRTPLFNGTTAHIEMLGLTQNLGKHFASLGVELWVRTAETKKRQTILQICGAKMELIELVISQDLDHELSPGMLYCGIRDQLYNELVVQADTNDLLLDGKWHHISMQIIDLNEDQIRLEIDGVVLRIRVGVHTCPYRFEGWGTPESPAFGCVGSEYHKQSNRLKGNLAEIVIRGGDLLLHYWPLRPPKDPSGEQFDEKGNQILLDKTSSAIIHLNSYCSWESAPFPDTSLWLDGCSYVNCGTIPGFGTEIAHSVAFDVWFYPATDESKMTLFGVSEPKTKKQSLSIKVHTDELNRYSPGWVSVHVKDDDGNQMSAAIPNVLTRKWNHLSLSVCDVQNHSLRVELNGKSADVRMGLLQSPCNFSPFESWLAIAAHNNNGTPECFFNGSIKAFKIWTGKGRRGRCLLAHWQLNEGPGSTILMDSSGNGNNGIPGRKLACQQTRQSMRRTSSMRLRRKASLQLLNTALDISTKYTKWMAGIQPKVSDDDIEEEHKRQRLIEQADKLQHCEALSGQVRIALIEIAISNDILDGIVKECVRDLIHADVINDVLPNGIHGPVIPESCWETCTHSSLHLTMERAFKQSSLRESSHQLFVFSVGNVQIFIFNVQGRPANQRLVLHPPTNGIYWVGPLQLVGRDSKVKHLSQRGTSSIENYLCKNGCGNISKIAPSTDPDSHSHFATFLHRSLNRSRQSTPCSFVMQPQTLESMQAAFIFNKVISEATIRESVILIQKIWRGFVVRNNMKLV